MSANANVTNPDRKKKVLGVAVAVGLRRPALRAADVHLVAGL
jgi:hypothetical protein